MKEARAREAQFFDAGERPAQENAASGERERRGAESFIERCEAGVGGIGLVCRGKRRAYAYSAGRLRARIYEYMVKVRCLQTGQSVQPLSSNGGPRCVAHRQVQRKRR